MLEAKTRCFTQVAAVPQEKQLITQPHGTPVPCVQQLPRPLRTAAPYRRPCSSREHALPALGQFLGPLGRVRPTRSALLTPSRVTQHSRPAQGRRVVLPVPWHLPLPRKRGEEPEPQGARRGGLPAGASGSPILGGHRQAPSSCPRSPCGRVGSPCCPQVVCKTPRLGGGSESWGSFHEPAAKVTHPGLTREDTPVNCQPNRAP